MGFLIKKSKKAFATRSQLFPCVQACDSNACVQRRRLGQVCQAAETMMHTVMQISQSSDLCDEQEKPIFKTSLVNYRHCRWCPAVSSFLLVLIPFQVAAPQQNSLFVSLSGEAVEHGSTWRRGKLREGKRCKALGREVGPCPPV